MEIIGDFNTSVKKALEEIDPTYEKYDGLVICGTHAPHDTEMMISKIREARETGRPSLLICFGYQLGAIEYGRNILGIKDATSEEFGTGTFVVKKRDKLKVGLHKVGDRYENFWSYYEAEEYPIPENWVSVPYHPEYESSKFSPHPLLIKFLKDCKKYGKILV